MLKWLILSYLIVTLIVNVMSCFEIRKVFPGFLFRSLRKLFQSRSSYSSTLDLMRRSIRKSFVGMIVKHACEAKAFIGHVFDIPPSDLVSQNL